MHLSIGPQEAQLEQNVRLLIVQCLHIMNKRKIEINQLKRTACKGKKFRTITAKYETVWAYFKQKESKDMNVFQIKFMPIISELVNHLATAELVSRLQTQSKQPLKQLTTTANVLKLQYFQLKLLSKQYPLQQICSCLSLEGGDKKYISIHKSKLMILFKHMRTIYTDFCYCVGEKIIVEPTQLKILYQLFEAHWNKNEEKGRINAIQRLQKKICKSLFFIGILIENNILQAIQASERKKREEQSECGTKSQHKKNIKGINQQSTVHTYSSFEPSNLSVRLKSEASQQENFPNSRNNLSQYSQKSQKIVSRSRFQLWDKAEIKQIKFKLVVEKQENNFELQQPKYEINYLSNDVENILIEQAFKIERLFTNPMQKDNQYVMVDYASVNPNMYSPHPFYPQPQPQPQPYGYYMANSYYPYNYNSITYQNHYIPQQYLYSNTETQANDNNELNQLKRSLGCLNLVQTRKKDKDRYQ